MDQVSDLFGHQSCPAWLNEQLNPIGNVEVADDFDAAGAACPGGHLRIAARQQIANAVQAEPSSGPLLDEQQLIHMALGISG